MKKGLSLRGPKLLHPKLAGVKTASFADRFLLIQTEPRDSSVSLNEFFLTAHVHRSTVAPTPSTKSQLGEARPESHGSSPPPRHRAAGP